MHLKILTLLWRANQPTVKHFNTVSFTNQVDFKLLPVKIMRDSERILGDDTSSCMTFVQKWDFSSLLRVLTNLSLMSLCKHADFDQFLHV